MTTLEAILMDTLISGQLYLWPPSQNPAFLNSIQTLYFYIPVSSQLKSQTPLSRPKVVHSW